MDWMWDDGLSSSESIRASARDEQREGESIVLLPLGRLNGCATEQQRSSAFLRLQTRLVANASSDISYTTDLDYESLHALSSSSFKLA